MAEKKIPVHLLGADPFGWALAEDLRQTIEAVESFAKPVKPAKAALIHSVWWQDLLKIPEKHIAGKPVLCNLSGEWARYEKDFSEDFSRAAALVKTWVVRSYKARKQLEDKGLNCFYIPYTIDTKTFKPLPEKITAPWQKKWKLPKDKYLIGSFMRDTEGANLTSPKEVKGPDIFVEILKSLHGKSLPVHAVLAGPRRHWIRKALDEAGVPYTFIGKPTAKDDMRKNMMPRDRLNILYNLIDLCLITSRSEAGPHAVLEAAAAACKVISTPVGICDEFLNAENIFETPAQAAALIKSDIANKALESGLEAYEGKVASWHTPDAAAKLYFELYEQALKNT